MEKTHKMNLAISLPLSNEAELDALIAQISDPTSPNYRHYLTPEEFAQRFAPSEQDYQTLTEFAQKHGLTVTGTHSNRLLLDVTGAVSDVEDAFHVHMGAYKNSSRGEYYAPDREPTMDLDLAVVHVSGLDNYFQPKPMNLRDMASTGGGPEGEYVGSDFRAAYAPNVTLTGAGQTIGLFELDGFYTADVARNFALAGLPAESAQAVLLDGFNGAPGEYNIEVILDIMMAAYMAPGAQVVSYEGYIPDDILNRMATDNTAKQLSSSWAFWPDPTTEQIFKQFSAQGQSFFQAAGDTGAYWDGVMAPADDPNVTSVGGTILSTSGAAGSWTSETGWSAGGGGISIIYPIPSYQQGFNMAASGASTTMRNIPDVSMIASNIALIYNNGGQSAVNGTSAAAPLWAGFTALVNQQAIQNGKQTVGLLNPILYAIGNSGNYSTDFHDITAGNNGYPAVTGYDLATGWGTPAGQGLINDLSQAPSGSFTLSTSAPSLTLYQASTASTSVTVTPNASFEGVVGYSVNGLPSGVTVKLNPSDNSTTSTLVFTSSISTVPGIYTIQIVGTTGSYSNSVPLTLNIPAPSFGLTPSVSAATLLVGSSSATSVITVNDQNGFTGKVSLTLSGLPTGVTATLSSASTSTTSTLTFKSSAACVPGTYTVTVNGTSGTLASSTTVQITVLTPSFSLTSSTSAETILVGGQHVQSTVSVVNPVGLAANVALTVSGLPTGLTASFNTTTPSTSATLTLTPSATIVPGVYTVTVNGTSATATGSVSIQINVPTPSFSLTPSASAITLFVAGKNVAPTISVTNPVGLAANVALSVTGVPSGVTASLSVASTSVGSTLTLIPSTATVPGSYTVTVNGISGTASGSASIQINVPTPSFSLTSSTSAETLLVGGAHVQSTVTVVNPVGLGANVALSVSGLPAGLTASFNTTTPSTSATLTLTPSATIVPGVYTVTVNGTSSSVTSSASIQVNVPTPSFGLATSASSLTLQVSGSNATSSISVTNPVGLASTVALTVSGLPTGVTASLSAASTSTTSTLTLTPSASSAPGTYAVAVTGTSATASASTAIQLVIPTPE